jgi:hypothetical protein
MASPERDPDRRIPGAVFAIAAAAAVLVAFAASPLPRITPDSAVYLTGAESIAESGEFAGCEREITEYAPGYSAALAVFVTAGLGAPDAARIVNALATAILVLLAALLARAAALGNTAPILVSLATAAAPVTFRNGAAVWSEQLFCALLAALLVAIVDSGRGLEARVSRRVGVVLLLSWALLYTRYSGLFVVPAILLAAWLGSRDLPQRVLRVTALAGAVGAVPALWYLRNVDAGTGPLGSRSGSGDSFGETLRQLPDGLSSIILPVDTPLVLRFAVFVPLALAAALALRRPVGLVPAVLWVVVGAYVVGLAYAATRTILDPVDARLLSPIFVPGAVLVAVGVTQLRGQVEAPLRRALRLWAVAVVVCMVLIAPGVVWYLHDVDRELVLDFPVSCADWPARYDLLRAPPP